MPSRGTNDHFGNLPPKKKALITSELFCFPSFGGSLEIDYFVHKGVVAYI